MEWIIFGVVVTVMANCICIPYLIKEMAVRNFFFTLVDEGSAKAIMGAGDSGFQKFVWQFKNYTLNNPRCDSEYDRAKDDWEAFTKKSTGPNKIIKFFGLTGMRWLGLPGLHTVHSYRFRWNSLRQSADDNTTDAGGIYFIPHDEVINYILLQEDVYYARVESAEDQDMVPLDFDITLRIKIVNPYKALFKVQEWLEATWSEMLPGIRRFIATRKWEQLTKEIEKTEKDYEALQKTAIQKLKEKFGVEITCFRILRSEEHTSELQSH